MGARGAVIAFFVANDLTVAVTQLMAPHAGRVDFHVYFSAAQALAHGRSPYISPPPCCFNPRAMIGYTYPPLFAFVLIPLTRLSVDDAGRIWLAVNYVSLVGMFLIGVRIARPRLSPEIIAWLALAMLASPRLALRCTASRQFVRAPSRSGVCLECRRQPRTGGRRRRAGSGGVHQNLAAPHCTRHLSASRATAHSRRSGDL